MESDLGGGGTEVPGGGSCQERSSNKCCIIHYQDEDQASTLVSPKDISSWETLLHAAQVRDHKCLLSLDQTTLDGVVPVIYYHRRCRSRFTMKRDLDLIRKKAGNTTDDHSEDDTPIPKKFTRRDKGGPSTSRVYDKLCVFCNKNKYKKKENSRETLIQCTDLRSDTKLRDIATQKQDSIILAIVSRDIVAAEAHYHRSCYKEYTRSERTLDTDAQIDAAEDIAYYEAERNAYSSLFEFIRTDFLQKPRVIKMTDITIQLVSFMTLAGIHSIRNATRKHVRRCLETEFEDVLQIFPDDKGKLLVMPDSLSVQDLAKENMKLADEIKSMKITSSGDDGTIDTAASCIRMTIKQNEQPQPWPYLPDTLSRSTLSIPQLLKRFLVCLLTGEAAPKKITDKVHWLVESFAQDLIYAVSRGKQKPPKHLLLPAAVKALTGNVELIQALNRLGHGVSYSQIEENDTALCLRKLAATSEGVVLPENTFPHLFTTMAWDNIDILEETLTGAGTSHRVNGIIVQPTVCGPHQQVALPTVEKKKQRSITVEETNLPIYNPGQRTGPGPITTHFHNYQHTDQVAFQKNFLWLLTRQVDQLNQSVCAWTGFNITVRIGMEVNTDSVGYLPTINAPATEMATASEILNQAKQIMNQLKITKVVLVFDQALFAKVAEVLWKQPMIYQGIIMRLGTFHTICNVLSILGKRFQDAGLRDLCLESGIIAEGSVAAVMDGRHYNRAVRIHKYVYEALMRLAWRCFLTWLENRYPDKMGLLEQALEHVSDFHDDLNNTSYHMTLDLPAFVTVTDLFSEYLSFLRHENGPLSALWMSYVDIVGKVLLGLIRASREGDWLLHMSSVSQMIPWCFAYDKVNYSRYLSVYYGTMSNLETSDPDIFEYFMQGGFSVQLGAHNPFGRIPVDQTTEETVNKDTKTPGGVRKYSLKQGAVSRYYLTAEYRSAFLRQFREMINLTKSAMHHAELQSPRITKDEIAVTSVVNTLDNWINPFENDCDIISLSSATAAPTDIVNDLLRAENAGLAAYQKFKEERLETQPPKIKFHDPLRKQKLKTFTDLSKTVKKVKASGREIILKADRMLFGKMILIAQTRKDLNMKDVLCHPLGPLPWSLATPDGKQRKTNKSTLAKELQKNVSVAEVIPQPSATIVDGMALVQRTKGDQKTFGQVASSILASALHEGSHSQRIDIVFDVYKEQSIKNMERLSRSTETGVQFKNISSGQIVRQWRNFLTNSKNKTSLIEFLLHEWMKPRSLDSLGDKVLFVTCGSKCYKLKADTSQEVPDLETSQEEADTRIMLHAVHAANDGNTSVVISADDTDVFLLAISFCEQVQASVFIKSGTKARTSYVDVGKLSTAWGTDICRGILGLHAFTGCDTVSSFAGKGKLSALKLLTNDRATQQTLCQLGQEWHVSPELFHKLEIFSCRLYGCKLQDPKVNELRYNLFCSKKGELESYQLPPCSDCLLKHSQRANYQAAIWKRSIIREANIPSPVGLGWILETEPQCLGIDWMQGSPAPDSVLELLACKCRRSCQPGNCPCMINGLKCSEMCQLQTCQNQPIQDVPEEVEDNTSDDDDDDFDEYDY